MHRFRLFYHRGFPWPCALAAMFTKFQWCADGVKLAIKASCGGCMWKSRNKIRKERYLAGPKDKVKAIQARPYGEIQSVNDSFVTSEPAVKSGLTVLILGVFL